MTHGSSSAFSPRKVFWFAAALLALSIGSFTLLLIPSSYYPYVIFEVDEPVVPLDGPLRIVVLQSAKPSLEQCEATTRRFAKQLSACKLCKVVENRCLDRLDADQRRLFTRNALPFPVFQTPNALISYTASDPRISREACAQSELQAVKLGQLGKATCYEAGVERTEHRSTQSLWALASNTFRWVVQALALLTACFALMLVVRCVSVAHPTEGAIRPALADPSIKISNVLKRFIDVVVSCTALIVMSPVLVLVALLLYIVEGVPVFYVSQRFISTTRCVAIFKFRTMVRDAASPKYALKERFMRSGYLDVPLQCEVYTPVGRLLERTQLVEVLQFFNILLDGMSLIGNRPLPADNIEALKRFAGWERRFDCPAGITGIAQIVGKHCLSPEQRLELESLYGSVYRRADGNILWCDFLIVIYTIRLLVFGKNLSFADAKALLRRAHAEERQSDEAIATASGSNH